MNYLVAGTSRYLVEKEIKRILGTGAYTKIDYNEITMEEIVTEASYNDLFGDKKNIIVKNAHIFNEKDEKATKILEKYLQNSNENTTLIFVCDKVNERLKSVTLFKDYGHVIIMKIMYANEATTRLMEEVKGSGYTISYEDAKYILDCSLNNFDIAMQNVEKLFIYYGKPCKIETSDVRNLTSSSLEDNQFKFVDAVIGRNYALAFKMINDFKVQKLEPFVLFNMLVREFRNMLFIKKSLTDSSEKNAILNNLGLAKWQLDKLVRNSANYKEKELQEELIKLAKIDLDIKCGNIDKYLALEMYLLGR
ncbi:MAG: DNA polymerase III subunit delta [bacterium]|nr:DNA polymerase III subunit delta [bacterium]